MAKVHIKDDELPPYEATVMLMSSDTTEATLMFAREHNIRSLKVLDKNNTTLFATTVPNKICCNFRDAVLRRPDDDDTFECTTTVSKWDRDRRANTWVGSITIGVHPRGCGYIEISHPPGTQHLFYIENGEEVEPILDFLS